MVQSNLHQYIKMFSLLECTLYKLCPVTYINNFLLITWNYEIPASDQRTLENVLKESFHQWRVLYEVNITRFTFYARTPYYWCHPTNKST
jgi:hypothetical protein